MSERSKIAPAPVELIESTPAIAPVQSPAKYEGKGIPASQYPEQQPDNVGINLIKHRDFVSSPEGGKGIIYQREPKPDANK